MRSSISGSLTIAGTGVRTDVALYPMHSSSAELRLSNAHQCPDGEKTPFRQPKWCDHCNRIVEKDEPMLKYLQVGEQLAFFTKEEVDRFAGGESGIEVRGFVGRDVAAGLMHLEESRYWVRTKKTKGKNAAKDVAALAIIEAGLRESDVVAVGTVVSRGKKSIILLRADSPDGEASGYPWGLVAVRLYWPENMNSVLDVPSQEKASPSESSVEAMLGIIAKKPITAEDVASWKDDYAAHIQQLAETRLAGGEIELPSQEAQAEENAEDMFKLVA